MDEKVSKKLKKEDCIDEVVIHQGTEDEFLIKGYVKNKLYCALFYIFGVLSIGLFFLFGYWYPIKRMKFTHDKTNLNEATVLLIFEKEENQYYLSEIKDIRVNDEEEVLNKDELTDFECNILSGSKTKRKYFFHKFLRYIFNHDCSEVSELSGLDNVLDVRTIYNLSQGLTAETAQHKRLLHGENHINVPVRSYFIIFLQLIADPFYIFQVFSITLWYADMYYYYTSTIVLMTLVSLCLNTYETKSHLNKLHDMVGQSTEVTILEKDSNISGLTDHQANGRNGDVVTKSSRDLVPGDLLVIPPEGMNLPCDAVLLNGRCVVNESTLTGESFPTTKTALDGMTSSNDVMYELYSVSKHKRHTLYNGTEILQAHFYGGDSRILAVVMRTGFCTLKGRLIRSIIHPKPVHFTFFRDSMRFILFIAFLAFLGFLYSMITLIRLGEPPSTIIRKSLDIFTIAVPPELPACMSVGLMYALHRMKKQQIFCVDPSRVNLCGKIKLFVFDKTGTLTEDSLEVSGVIQVENEALGTIEHDIDNLQSTEIIKGMACCHSLTIIKNELTGDPLDMYMFDFTKWNFNEPSDEQGSKFELLTPITVSPPSIKSTPNMNETNVDNNNDEIAILKQYPFESSLQRMSVITKNLHDKNMVAYVKGSPEMIMSMCRPDSIPQNIQDVLLDFTKTGSRVLAIATKVLNETKWHKIKKLQRSEVENQLNFLGLIIFENVLKDVSKSVIEDLQSANIRTVMATGDNLYTASSVGREVNIVKSYQKIIKLEIDEKHELIFQSLQDHTEKISNTATTTKDVNINIEFFNSLDYCLALSGTTYMKIREHHPFMLDKILLSASVFARMSPDQKTTLVEDLKRLGYGVGMCGDGANDCGALKAAHAGIALSDTEASVASPFTSKVFDISCVPKLLKEGRATLVTSFCIFKYMAMYSFIQFIGVLILYTIGSNYSDWQYMYADLFVNLPLVVTMIQSEASNQLTTKRPPGRLVHPIFLAGIFLQVIALFCFQFGVYLYIQQMQWYKKPNEFKENDDLELYFMCYENYAVILISFFQYSWLSIVCSSGKPHRQPVYKNYKYTFLFVVTTTCTVVLTLYPPTVIQDLLLLAVVPSKIFSASLLLIALGHLYVAYVLEKIVLPSEWMKRLSDRIQKKTEPKNKYKHIYNALKKDINWPPLTSTDN